MNKIYIVAETDTLTALPGRMATANIWLEINGLQFPMHRWNDSVVVVLNWWTLGLLRLLSGVSTRETINFMEGPYAVEVAMFSFGMLRFRALEGSARANQVATGEEPVAPFVLGLISQSREILDACKQQGWWSNDAETLESSLKDLRKEATRLLQ